MGDASAATPAAKPQAGKKGKKAKTGDPSAERTLGKPLGHDPNISPFKHLPRSPLFEQCYRGALIPEDEWELFMEALGRDLPVTFRFAGAHPLSAMLAAHMEREFLAGGALDPGEEFLASLAEGAGARAVQGACRKEPLAPFAWLPGAWRLDIPKAVLRKAPGPKRLHGFMKRCVTLGVISRQEAVSMVPCTLMGGGAGLRVLDVCASPGMKTLQLMDAAGAAPAPRDGVTAAEVLGGGAVVSNELDGRRCCMLAHHVLRVRHPAGLCIHHDATALPVLGGAFDRVLCDVPCSGDGTIRKAPQLLAGWRPNRANALHALQLRIACAGAVQLAVGGRMVYSTCALSPVEDEAVVAALLLRAGGALELVDVGTELDAQTLPRRPGLEHWEVPAGARRCKATVLLKGPEEAAERQLKIPGSAWPPSGEEAARLGLPGVLRRCWRFFPHLGDGGGFFVAVLRRVRADEPGSALREAAQPEASPDGYHEIVFGGRQVAPELYRKAVFGAGAAEDARRFAPPPRGAGAGEEGEEEEEEAMPEDAVCKEALPAAQREAKLVAATQNEHARELVEAALKFYGLDLPVGNFFVRNDGDGRNMYLASDAVRDVLCASPNLRVMVGGVRVFDENRFLKSSGCSLRLCQEGVCWLAPLMRRRVCEATAEEMRQLLDGQKRNFTDLDEGSKLRAQLQEMDAQGSVAIVCQLPGGRGSISAVAERGAECIALFVNQHEMRELRETMEEFVLSTPA